MGFNSGFKGLSGRQNSMRRRALQTEWLQWIYQQVYMFVTIADDRIQHQCEEYSNDIAFILSFATVYRLVSDLISEWSQTYFINTPKKKIT